MKPLVVTSLVLALGLSSKIAAAESGNAASAANPEPTAELNPGTASLLSFTGAAASFTVAGIGLERRDRNLFIGGAVGALFLPSAGRWYAHTSGVGAILLRTLGAGIAIGGVVAGVTGGGAGGAIGLLVAGGAMIVGGTLYDLYRAPLDAIEHNTHLSKVQVVPTVQPEHHSNGFGFSLSARF